MNQERRISLRIDDVVLWRDGLTIMLLGTQVGADGEMAGLQLMQVDASAITHPMEKTPECLVCGNLNDALVQLVRHATLGQDPTQGEWTALDGRFRFRWRHMSDDRRIVGLIEASPRPAIGWDQPDQQELPWPLLIVAALLFIAIWGALSLVRWRRTSALRRSASD